MVRFALRPTQPFVSFPSVWDDEDLSVFNNNTQGLEVYETDNEVVVKAAVPGIKATDIDVTFEDGVLRINARSEETEEEKKKKKVVYQAHRVNSFSYTTTLPRAIDASNLSAEVENGIVTITAPLAAESMPKKVVVKAK